MKPARQGSVMKSGSPSTNQQFDKRVLRAIGARNKSAPLHLKRDAVLSKKQSYKDTKRSDGRSSRLSARSQGREPRLNPKRVRSPNEYRAPCWGAPPEGEPIDS